MQKTRLKMQERLLKRQTHLSRFEDIQFTCPNAVPIPFDTNDQLVPYRRYS